MVLRRLTFSSISLEGCYETNPAGEFVFDERAQTSTQDFIKLLISLASGVIALSATFIPKFSDHTSTAVPYFSSVAGSSSLYQYFSVFDLLRS